MFVYFTQLDRFTFVRDDGNGVTTWSDETMQFVVFARERSDRGDPGARRGYAQELVRFIIW